MISKMILSSECFTTDITRVRPLISVSSLVNEEIVTLGELSVAILADELFLGSGRPAGSPEESRVVVG